MSKQNRTMNESQRELCRKLRENLPYGTVAATIYKPDWMSDEFPETEDSLYIRLSVPSDGFEAVRWMYSTPEKFVEVRTSLVGYA